MERGKSERQKYKQTWRKTEKNRQIEKDGSGLFRFDNEMKGIVMTRRHWSLEPAETC